eukprot:244806-Pelagomonas_calceolata.AAC.1
MAWCRTYGDVAACCAWSDNKGQLRMLLLLLLMRMQMMMTVCASQMVWRDASACNWHGVGHMVMWLRAARGDATK